MFSLIAVLALPLAMETSSVAAPARSIAPVDSANMTLVVVQNDRDVRVTVYAEDTFGDHKLGVVEPRGTATLALNEYISTESEVQFFVQPVGELEESTEHLEVHRGDRIGLVVPPR